ncbi:hypothetical protein DQP58_26040 [Mycobacterium colombiense]|uniref:Uncharacterized protein n=2 Tax=Mycobacterium colombiense TaxID=339268 RepID=A0A329K4B5_9MYCO|nr:hypothetical protein DQP58_26040 [Mycobacterium colombiense]
MTMKIRMAMAGMQSQLETKLAEHGLTLDQASQIHKRVGEALSDDASRFQSMQQVLGIAGSEATSLGYTSVLWPGFDFKATASESGLLKTAGYRHTRRSSSTVDSPTELPIWSVDVNEFQTHFGSLTLRGKWPLFDEFLPAYEEYEFGWKGERYGARFIWGLFLSSSIYWD